LGKEYRSLSSSLCMCTRGIHVKIHHSHLLRGIVSRCDNFLLFLFRPPRSHGFDLHWAQQQFSSCYMKTLR
jgi:hypothetical protein